MCDPVAAAVASTVLSVATVGAGFVQGQQAADAQEAYQEERFRQTQVAANQAYLNQAAQSNLRLSQEREAASAQAQDRLVQRLRAQSTARVSAGESGVSGLSVDALLNDFRRSQGVQDAAARRNLDLIGRQTDLEIDGFRAQAAGRTAAATPQPVARPSFLSAALQIGTAVAGGVQGYQRSQTPAPRGRG